MKKTVIGLLLLVALLAAGCGTKEKDSAAQSKTDTTAQAGKAGKSAAAAPSVEDQKFATDLQMNPSGVRYKDMTVGTGKEIVQGSNVVFDYSCWLADPTGLVRTQGVGTSVGRPGQAFKGTVGVHPLPGLSDGLVGMRVGGSRRIFVPASLGFPAGHPMVGSNLIYEAIDIKEISPEEVAHFQDSLTSRLALLQHLQDSLRKADQDSLAAQGPDSLGQPQKPTEGKE